MSKLKKIFTISEMKKILTTAHSDGRLYTKEEKKMYSVDCYVSGLLGNILKEKKGRTTYPCIMEVSQTEDFIDDPFMKSRRKQVCIGKAGGKFVCIESKEEQVDWMLGQVEHSIKSGGLTTTLGYWNYARKI